MISDIACSRKQTLPIEFKKCKSMFELLPKLSPPGAMQRLGVYERSRATRHPEGDSYLADLDHNYGSRGPSPGRLWPCMLTHNCIFSFKRERLVVEGECFAAMGVDWYPSLCGLRGRSPLVPLLSQLMRGEQRFLAGNSIHIPSIFAWMLYIWCNCVRRCDHERLVAAPASTTDSAEEQAQEFDME